MQRTFTQHRRGLNAVELIVVIAVCALLIGLAAPALSGARHAGRAALCQSNLRQMAFAAHAYANVYDAFPVAVQYAKSAGIMHDISWDWVTVFGTGELVSPGPLWQFTNDPHHVMQCPQYHGASNAPGDPYTGYNYSTYLGGEEKLSMFNPGPHNLYHGVKPTAVRRPAEIAMFGCGGSKGGTNKYMRSPLHNQHAPIHPTHGPLLLPMNVIYTGGQGFRYRGATFIAYVDGHVGSVHQPEKGKNATDMLLSHFMNYPRNGFLSNDSSAYDPRP